jgi:nicotinamide mononucleotide adenylyltransferase
MSPEQIDRNQIIEEINLIPEDKRKELYNLIHQFRISLERCAPRWRSQSHDNVDKIMQFAGNWSDLSEEEFSNFSEEIEQRRQAYSSRFISF